ncbi:MAG: sugar phosphate isomerase/epimerase family protein [Planctomycetaceae bacterium]
MFVCVSTRCFPGQTLEQACTSLSDLEFDKFEIWVDDATSKVSPADIADDPDDFAARLRDQTRLSPVAFCLGSESVGGEQFAGLAKAAKLLSITQITVPAAPLGTPFNAEIDRLKELVGLGRSEGVRVSIKTQSGRLTEDPRTAVELCQAAKGLGLTIDPSYYLASPLGEQACEMMFPHTFHVHLRDSTPSSLQVQVGLGEIDYSHIISRLQRQRYNRGLSIELLPELTEPDAMGLELRKLRMLLTTLL